MLFSFVLGLVILAGAINGVAGFGFALVGTMGIAMVIDPAVAVVFMIIPILAVNGSLIRELSKKQLQTCGRRFAPLLGASVIGTAIGLILLDWIPADPLRVLLGVVAIGFVLTAQQSVPVPGLERAKSGCFVEGTPAMIGVGGVSGLLFGGTNVGVQLVAYLRSCNLSHGLFVGVVAMTFLGLNVIRIGIAGVLGLYPDFVTVGWSLIAAIPAVIGVALGKRLRGRVPIRWRRILILGLITMIGLRLLLSGIGI